MLKSDFSLRRMVASALLLSSLGLIPTGAVHAAGSDWDALGGRDVVTTFTTDAVNRWRKNPVLVQFAQTDDAKAARLVVFLVEQFCAETGGGCTYPGKNMTEAHAGMNITTAQFNALAEDLQFAMDAANVPFRAQNKLLAKLAPMLKDMKGR